VVTEVSDVLIKTGPLDFQESKSHPTPKKKLVNQKKKYVNRIDAFKAFSIIIPRIPTVTMDLRVCL